MTAWVKVHNSMPTHGKLLLAGDRAGWLFVCGLCYSNEHLTNGFVARHALPAVAPGVKNPNSLAARLVAAGLWHEVDGGWRIHDYEQHQQSADDIRDRRAKDSARKAASRSNGSPRGQSADSPRIPSGVRDVEEELEEERTNISSSGAAGADEKSTEDDKRLCRLLAELAKARNPKFKVKSRSRWLTEMRLLRERDDNTPQEIEQAIRWLFTDPGRDAQFWADTVQSAANLREHFPTIWAKMTASPKLRAVPDVEDSAAFLRRRGVA